MLTWEQCRADFEADGSLRDIYVLDTTIDQWRSVYAMLQANYQLTCHGHMGQQPPPLIVDHAFADTGFSRPLLVIQVGQFEINCHFFKQNEIEFDFRPEDITSQTDLGNLLQFLKQIGDLCKKPFSVHPENYRKVALITYDADKKEFRGAE